MKKIICILLVVAFATGCFGYNVLAEVDEQYQETVFSVGDVNSDGNIDVTDALTLSKVLLNTKKSYMDYDLADLNGDNACDIKDYLLLQKKLSDPSIKINNERFSKDDKDITNELVDLGLNNFDYKYNDLNYSYTVSRNPYDMISVRDMVMVSGGNYQDNTGPVQIRSYTRAGDEAGSSGLLDTEQVNRFYKYDDRPYAVAIDPKTWQAASIYYMYPKLTYWISRADVINNCIHCYDMAKYNGKYFFCGSAVSYDSNYNAYSGKNVEMTKATVYLFTGDNISSSSKNDYKEVDLVYKDGTVIDYTSNLVQKVEKKDSGDYYYYYTTGVPRIYDLYELNGELYALYYNQYSNLYEGEDKNYNFNGFYKYDEAKNQFIFDSSLDIQPIIDRYNSQQDAEKIQHDFEWKGTHYFIMEGLFSTKDLKTFTDINLPNYEDYKTHDAIVRSGKVYLLASKENSNGTYTNVVLETEDFKTYRPILHFLSKAFARSFEFNNGAFFFGLGAHLVNTNPDIYPEKYEINKECGRIYRYIYYK